MSCERADQVVIPITLLVRLGDQKPTEIDLEEYVKGSLPAYLEEQAPVEALKALSMAIRSIAATSRQHARDGFDLCTSGHCLDWQPARRSPSSDRAVEETAHKILAVSRAGGAPERGGETAQRPALRAVPAPFFQKCDGHTRSSSEGWSNLLSHCRSVACPCGGLELDGHGVGLCLAGALEMARQGASAPEILKHYYAGAEPVTARVCPRSQMRQSLIVGRVVDSAGRPQPGVTLLLKGPAGPIQRTAASDGRFWFSGLPAGDWDVAVRGSASHQPGLGTDGRNTVATQITVPGLPALEVETIPVAHPRMLIGTLGYGGVAVTISDSRGMQTTVESGSAPEFDPGGFAVPLPPPGPCSLTIPGQRFSIEIGSTGLWMRFVDRTTREPS